MRLLAAVTATAFLSVAALSAGAASAQAATAHAARDSRDSHSARDSHDPRGDYRDSRGDSHDSRGDSHNSDARFTVRVLGSVHLKRVDSPHGQTHTAYLVCTSTSAHGAAPVIHGSGGLRDATSACEELAAVNGRLDALAVHPAWMAPALEAPVTVQADGTWEGRRVAWSHRFANGGWLTRSTGDVFAF